LVSFRRYSAFLEDYERSSNPNGKPRIQFRSTSWLCRIKVLVAEFGGLAMTIDENIFILLILLRHLLAFQQTCTKCLVLDTGPQFIIVPDADWKKKCILERGNINNWNKIWMDIYIPSQVALSPLTPGSFKSPQGLEEEMIFVAGSVFGAGSETSAAPSVHK
jgi:hypothetical protein